MRVLNKNKKVLIKKLETIGFRKIDDKYILEKEIQNQFLIKIEYSNNILSSQIIDKDTLEEYQLVDIEGPIGEYAAEIKIEYEEYLDSIIEEVTIKDVFKAKQSRKVIGYIENKYQVYLEFLWKKFPKNAIFRNTETNKWFAILVAVEGGKIGLETSDEIEAVILKLPSEVVSEIVDNKTIFKGYHMNKRYWITIPLDERLKDEEIYNYIQRSYNEIS